MNSRRVGAFARLIVTARSKSPPVPQSIADTGLPEGFLVELLAKTIYRLGLERASEIANAMCLPANVIEALLEIGKEAKLIATLGQLGASMTADRTISHYRI